MATWGTAAMVTVVLLIGATAGCSMDPRDSVPEEPVVPRLGKVGMVVSLPGDPADYTTELAADTYETVKRAGVRVSHLYYTWGQVEERRGVLRWDQADWAFAMTKAHGMEASAEIKLIDVNHVGDLPADVTLSSFGDPALVERFTAFCMALCDRYAGTLRYLWIGNEIDLYLHERREQIGAYADLLGAVRAAVKEKHPGIAVGTVSTYHAALENNALDVIRTVGARGDLIAFSLYPQMIAGAGPSDIADHFDAMAGIARALGKRWAIVETGWSTEGIGGSEALQTECVAELFRAYGAHLDDMEFLGLFVLHDLPESANRQIAEMYGLGAYDEFLKFQGTLGLVKNDGTPKPAWGELLEQMRGLR